MRGSIVLAAAFAALLLVIGATCMTVWRKAMQAQDHVADLHTMHLETGNALNAIRASVYLNGILTRDYLLDLDPTHTPQYVEQFENMRAKTEESFRILASSGLAAEQRGAVQQLHRELNAYLDSTGSVLAWTAEEKREQRIQMLRQRARRRQEVFALAEQVEQLTTANFVRERRRITTADRDFRASLGWTTGIAMLFGCGIAFATLLRMLALERQSRAAESELRLLSGQIRTAQEEERKSLSRELHDQVGQMLTGLRMELASIARLNGDSESEISSRIARAKGTAEQTLRIIRNIAMLLRPSMLDDLGLTPALAWLVKEMSRSSGIEMRSEVDSRVDSLPEQHRTCIYRVVQEALTNASRHSGARRVDLTLSMNGGSVVGTVVDDGCGFVRNLDNRRGLGLLGMEERVRELGGAIRVLSTPGKGAHVRFELPAPLPTEVPHDTDSHRGRPRDCAGRPEVTA